MYLSKLEIIGFKSFAQKANLTFDNGISAIVGPNGCGKTNIVDAIRWVLGEQRYSALRSEKMEDVIFNGTKSRKPLGMAEVSLVIENTKGILPSEYSQVTVGRRLYRSGESEYLLNKAPCRLKDIIDIFMDTGMGADAYSVIELKMVETILNEKTDERRRLFEEAAGVTKYKHRRKAAYRKLENVQTDLVRVNDIVSEIQKAVNSLERQAKKAEHFNRAKARLREFEVDLMEREYAQFVSRMEPLKERLQRLSEDKSLIDVDLLKEEARLDALRNKLSDVEKHLIDIQNEVSIRAGGVNRVEQKNLIATERNKALHDNIERFETEKEELKTEIAKLEELKASLHKRKSELEVEQEQLSAEMDRGQSDLRESESRLDARKRMLQSLNDRTLALVQEIAEAQSSLDKMKGRVENLQSRSVRASEESSKYESEVIRIDGEITKLSQEDKSLRRVLTEAEMQYYEAEAKKKDLKDRIEELHGREVALRSEIAQIAAKVDFLKGLIESGEGLSEGVRFLFCSDQWTASRHLTVADAIVAEEKFRAAIESALGESTGFIIVDSAQDAETGIALLKQEKQGKATFVCLDRVPRITTRLSIPKMPGIVGWATDLVETDAAYAQLFQFLLDRTLIVEDRPTATEAVERIAGIRCVTLDGEIQTGVGITRGGSVRKDEGGIIGKQAQIESFRLEISLLKEQLASLRSSQEGLIREHDNIQLKSFGEAVKNIEKEMSGVEMHIAQLEFEKRHARDIIAKNIQEIETLTSSVKDLLAEIEAGAPYLEKLKNEKAEVERRLEADSVDLDSLETEWNTRAKAVNDLGIKIVALHGEYQSVQSDLKRAQSAIDDANAMLARRESDTQNALTDIGLAEVGMQENALELGKLNEELNTLQAQRSAIEDESTHIREEIQRIELKIKDARRHHDDSLQAGHDLELKIADLTAKADHIKARALEEYEISLELKTYPDDEFVDFATLRVEIQALRERLKSLGNINFAAYEEYNTEKERFEFLTAQRKDLLEAEKTLISTIEEINSTAQRKFLETFALIRTNFIETFKSLFDPGDECDLRLEDGVDPLEGQIEIIAKPRGKRPTSIDLLSGGEKTLTATALLFAIYLVKPSPFCILDEVDAPLDDANIDRFTRILRKFSDNTQFIVVTHNKRTMEAANALYGVTMEEEGVSKLVTVRFNQGSEVRSAALVSG